ncbi:MAG: hypothetical protein ACR2NI_05045 [Pirellulales bacterium]
MAYNFRDKDVAYELKRIANESMGQVSQPYQPSGNEVIIVKAPTAGIVAISGTEITSGECTRMFVDSSSDPVDITEDTSFTVEVFNTTGEDIDAGSYFQAARCGTAWVSVAGGGGGTLLTLRTTSVITARSGDTAGTGTAVSYEATDGITYVAGTEDPPFSIINPYGKSVSSGIVIQCRGASGGKLELVQAECEDA